MEEGRAVKRPLLVTEKLDCDSNHDQFSSSSVTFVVVFSTLIVACGSYAYGNAIGYSSPAESGIVNDLGLTLTEYSAFGSILNIGAMFGALWSGKIADVIGRKGAMGVSDLFFIMGWLAILFSKGAWSLDFGRFLVGCGVGLSSYVVPVYTAEITAKDVRGQFLSVKHLMISCGKALFFVFGSFVSWRALALLGLVPCLLQLLGLFFIPESPRWLMTMDRLKDSKTALYRLRGGDADISEEITDIKSYIEHCRRISGEGILSLFQCNYAYCLMVGVGLMVFQQFGGLSGMSFYTSTIFQSAGFSSKIGSTTVGIAQILMSITGICFIDRFGRRPLLLISAAGLCLGCVLTGLSFFFQDLRNGRELTPVLALIGVMVYYGSFGLGMEGMPWIISSEIFPINIKGSAGSFINVVSWTCSWLISFSFNFMFSWSSAGTFFIFAGICGANVLFIWKMVPETKGKTLEELQVSITHSPQ